MSAMHTLSKEQPSVITFVNGILGFEDFKQYELHAADLESPFLCLQAADSGYPSFIVCDPAQFAPAYSVPFSADMRERLQAQSDRDLQVLAIANIPSSIQEMTVNLKSPLIINTRLGLADQFVLDAPQYPIRHKVFAARTED